MKKTLLTLLTLILTVAIGAQVANAIGSLTPSGTAGAATQYTLNDIYTKLTSGTSTSTKLGLFAAPGSVVATFRTLTEIYTAIPTIDATKVAAGTSYLGVAGTLQGAFAPLIWQTDPNLTLCFSDTNFPCSEGSGLLNGEGAPEYCANLTAEGSSDWHLPTIVEYLSITDFGTIDNATQVSGFDTNVSYLSSTVFVSDSSGNWTWDSYTGGLGFALHNDPKRVRCVR